MIRTFIISFFVCTGLFAYPQISQTEKLLTDSSLLHASVSLCVKNADNGGTIISYNSNLSLIPASTLKLVTSAAAIELLGPQYTFKTTIGYTGTLNKKSGILKGNIIIRGGGDPALGSKYFTEHYQDLLINCTSAIKNTGIKKIDGKVITDDSYYDFIPVPPQWLFEDIGNYYGAGVYGLSVFDNTYEIHIQTLIDSSQVSITEIIPSQNTDELTNRLVVAGKKDKGYVFNVPYSSKGWIAGTIPANREDFILKAAVTDPPLLFAKMMTENLKAAGISISENPSTIRLENKNINSEIVPVFEIYSPPLLEIIKVLNHESVNLFAEHLLKELGKKFKNNGSTNSGIEVVEEFLNNAGLKTGGIFIVDGSGLSPLNAISTENLVDLLLYMKKSGKYFTEYYSSLPDAGKDGTLKYHFLDPIFDTRLKAKSGSMTRVRNYAGYFTTLSGNNMVFSIIINNYSGTPDNIINLIEETLKGIILNR